MTITAKSEKEEIIFSREDLELVVVAMRFLQFMHRDEGLRRRALAVGNKTQALLDKSGKTFP